MDRRKMDYLKNQVNQETLNKLMNDGKAGIPDQITNDIDLKEIKSPAR